MLSFTLSEKHMTYTKTHALILNHNKHITLTDLIIFMNSSNRFTYIIILVTNLCLFRFLVYGIELILIANLYLSDLTLVTPRIPVRPDWRIRTGFRDARLTTGTLFFFFFFKQNWHLWVWPTLIIIQNIIYECKELPPEWCPSNSIHT